MGSDPNNTLFKFEQTVEVYAHFVIRDTIIRNPTATRESIKRMLHLQDDWILLLPGAETFINDTIQKVQAN